MPHLPFATDDDDEFFHPTEGWLLLDRTIAFDSWISWRQALPRSRSKRARLTSCAADLITALAERLHVLHQQLPGYSNLDDTPFRFSRWWEPGSELEQSACSCLFSIDGISCSDVIDASRSVDGLSHIELSESPGKLIDARLVGPEVSSFISGQSDLLPSLPPAVRPQKKSRLRTSRTPPR
jgi:hypothetical protein